MANKITTVLEFVGADQASKQVKNLAKEFQNAEGFSNKAKVAASGFGNILKTNVAEIAVATGTAIAAFGVKSVQAFQDSALAAGKLSDATKLTVEESSRWIEVAGDLGVSTETLTGMFSKMERAIAANPEKMRELGIELQKNADGSVNVSETMLDAIDAIRAIKSPTEQAQRSQELFGRSYTEVAELIQMGAGNVRTALDNVSEAKVIDEAELEKARRLRESLDNLRDAVEDVALMFGEQLAPKVAETADNLVWLKENAADLIGENALGGIAGAIEDALNPIGMFNDAIREGRDLLDGKRTDIDNVTDSLKAQAEAAYEAAKASTEQGEATASAADIISESIVAAGVDFDATNERQKRFGADGVENMGTVEDSADDTADAIDLLRKAYDKLLDKLSDRSAYLDVEQGFDDLAAAATTAFETAASGEGDAEQAARDHERAIIDLKERVIGYGDSIEGLPPERVTDILALIDEGKLAEAEAKLALLERQRQVNLLINPVLTAAMPTTADGRVRGGRARGGPVAPRSLYDVVENGDPELLHVGGRTLLMTGDQGGMVTPTGGASAGVSSGSGSGGGRGQVSVTTNNHYHRWQVFGSDDRLVQQVVRRMSMMNRGRL